MQNIKRDKELQDIYDKIMSRDNVFLYAPGSMGKTHLIHQLQKKLEGRRVCFYRSLRGILSPAQYMTELVRDIKKEAPNHASLDYRLRRFLDENPHEKLQELDEMKSWLENLTTTLEQISLDFLFVFEDWHEWEFEDSREQLLKHFKKLNKARNIQLLISSNRLEGFSKLDCSHYELEGTSTNILTQSIPGIEESEANRLVEFTFGNTGYILRILEHRDKTSSLDEAMVSFCNDLHAAFFKMKFRFTDLQWRLLRAIAFDEKVLQPHSFDFLVKHRLGAASSVERALKNLSDSHMIEKTDEGWMLSNVLLLRWLQWLYSSASN